MTDLSVVLPNFPTDKYARLLLILEKNQITTADLLTLDSVDLAKKARPLTIGDAKSLSNAVQEALQKSLGVSENNEETSSSLKKGSQNPYITVDNEKQEISLRKTGVQLVESWSTISTLSKDLDVALGGGIPTGYITEVTGESGAGKTQFLLTLLLSTQLPSPHGLSAPAIYISTESSLPTTRLASIIKTHPFLSLLAPSKRPTLDRVICVSTPDLESQEHILRYQVPIAVQRQGVKLVILDSVAANYRAEFERPGIPMSGTGGGKNMAQRSSELVKLGELLRNLAREHGVAIVVANQVADRFSGSDRGSEKGGNSPFKTQSSPLALRIRGGTGPPSSTGTPTSSLPGPEIVAPFRGTPDPMSLDHQQRWFTGWGDDPNPGRLARIGQKTPSLGLIWTTQIACRIALIKRPVYGRALIADEETERGEPILKKWRRWMKVVFAPHMKPSGPGLEGAVEFEIKADGIGAVKKDSKNKRAKLDDEDEDMEDTPE